MIVIIIIKMIMIIDDSTKDESDMTHNGDNADVAARPRRSPSGRAQRGSQRNPGIPGRLLGASVCVKGWLDPLALAGSSLAMVSWQELRGFP